MVLQLMVSGATPWLEDARRSSTITARTAGAWRQSSATEVANIGLRFCIILASLRRRLRQK